MALHPNWRSLSTVDLPWKTFVREGESHVQQKEKTAPVLNQILTGDEAKRLYEEIVKVEPEKSSIQNASSASASAKTCSKPVQHVDLAGCSGVSQSPLNLDKTAWINKMMKAAQDNDVSSVSLLLKGTEFNINTVDQYGWTFLMCAAGAGSLDVVKLLVERGADIKVKDRSGNSCLSIAKKMKHFHVVNYITSGPGLKEEPIISVKSDKSTFYCDVCKRSFNDEQDTHLTSTVHLFNSHPGGSRTYYSIPESNRGFQILLKAGWDKEKGLGPEGSGQKFPLKTVLRRDRQGLGQPSKLPARVTHFDAFSPAAVRIERKCRGRKERENTRLKEKRKERMLRKILS